MKCLHDSMLQEEALQIYAIAGIEGEFFQVHKYDIAVELGVEPPCTA